MGFEAGFVGRGLVLRLTSRPSAWVDLRLGSTVRGWRLAPSRNARTGRSDTWFVSFRPSFRSVSVRSFGSLSLSLLSFHNFLVVRFLPDPMASPLLSRTGVLSPRVVFVFFSPRSSTSFVAVVWAHLGLGVGLRVVPTDPSRDSGLAMEDGACCGHRILVSRDLRFGTCGCVWRVLCTWTRWILFREGLGQRDGVDRFLSLGKGGWVLSPSRLGTGTNGMGESGERKGVGGGSVPDRTDQSGRREADHR